VSRVHLSYANALAPGDIRQLGRGDLITIAQSAKDRANYESILCALTTATGRGADIRWEETE
jgi:hypothetical protein